MSITEFMVFKSFLLPMFHTSLNGSTILCVAHVRSLGVILILLRVIFNIYILAHSGATNQVLSIPSTGYLSNLTTALCLYHTITLAQHLDHSDTILVRLGCCNKILGDLNNRYLFLSVMESGKYKMKMETHSSESPLPGLQTTAFSLCPHMVEREKATSHLLFF